MEWVIVRVTDGKYLATKSLYVHFCEFARRFRTKKQAGKSCISMILTAVKSSM